MRYSHKIFAPPIGLSSATSGLSRYIMGRDAVLYSNRTATVMMIIPNEYPREVMRSAMNFDAESKKVSWNIYNVQ
jgi:hypothetical protein